MRGRYKTLCVNHSRYQCSLNLRSCSEVWVVWPASQGVGEMWGGWEAQLLKGVGATGWRVLVKKSEAPDG